VAQYFSPLRERFTNIDSTPENELLWFHHVPWTHRMKSGRTLWDEMVVRYGAGIDSVRSMERSWDGVRASIDSARFTQTRDFLTIQEKEAKWWRDAALSYFGQFSRMPMPNGYDAPAHPLQFYMTLRCPADRNKPRCPAIY
jgi:alpha-glucuronidase